MTREQRYESLMTKQMTDFMTRAARRLEPKDFEDLLQETFLGIWKALDKFHYGSFYIWACTIMKSCFMNRWRAKRFKKDGRTLLRSTPHPDNERLSRMILAPEEIDNEIGDEMKDALESIRGIHREMILLVAVDDLTYDEAAHKVGVPIGTVMSRVCRAKRCLREQLEKQAS